MPIDPEARREIVSALSAFMRGEIDNFEFDDAIYKKLSRDEVLESVRTALWFTYDDCKVHRISVTEEVWNGLRRMMALLKSDLQQTPVQLLEPASTRRAKFLLRIGSLLSVLAAAYLAVTDAWYWLLVPGLLLGLPYCLVQIVNDKRGRGAEDPHPYYRFAAEAQWRRYEPLLEEEHLPTYNPAVHNRPIRSSVVATLLIIPGTILLVLLIPLFMLLSLLGRRDPD